MRRRRVAEDARRRVRATEAVAVVRRAALARVRVAENGVVLRRAVGVARAVAEFAVGGRGDPQREAAAAHQPFPPLSVLRDKVRRYRALGKSRDFSIQMLPTTI